MKKMIYAILCFSLILSNIPFSNVQANNTSIAKEIDLKYLTYEIIDGEVIITDCDETVSGDLIIPSEIEGYPVTAIGDDAFYATKLTNLVIPDTVTYIGEGAFTHSSLVNITLSKNMDVLKSNTFNCCYSLENVIIPFGIKIIESYAFDYSKKIKKVILPDSVITIEDNAFRNTSIEEIRLSSNLETIGKNAFQSTSLKEVIIPDSVTTIGEKSFYNCKELTHVTLPKNLKIIEKDLFMYCHALQSVNIPFGVEEIKDNAFNNCDKMIELTMPDSVHTIGFHAIASCDSLEKINLSNGLKNADKEAIYSNKNLLGLELPRSLNNFHITSFDNGGFIVGCYKNSYAANFLEDNNKEFYFIDGTTKENTLSGTYENMYWEINRKTGEMIINCDGEMPIDSNNLVPWQYGLRKYITNVIIAEGCTSIAESAFSSCSRLVSVLMPSTLEVIEERAFYMADLNSIDIPDNVTVIGNFAFEGNTNLKSVKLPSNLLMIGNSAFTRCQLTEIKLPEYLLYIGRYAFFYNDLTEIDIPGYLEYVGPSAFAYNDLEEVIFPHSVAYIGEDVVVGNERLKKIVVYRKDCQFGARFSTNKITVYGFKGSTAETLANEQRDNFIELSNVDIASLKLIAALEYNQIQYDGKAKEPSILINGLIEGIDYTVSYLDNINAGIGIIVIKGIGDYTGEGYMGFEILPIDANEYNVKLSYTQTTYNGQEKTPTVTVTDKNGKTLVKDKDYLVTYNNNVNVGSATATITFIGNYNGEITKTFTINPGQIHSVTLDTNELTLTKGNTYQLKATIHPNVCDTNTLTWTSSNSNVVTVDKTGKLTAIGVGNATITVTTLNGKKATCTITVKDDENINTGDVNNDGKVNQLDRMTLARYLAKWQGYDQINDKNSDVNSDNKVNQLDRMTLARYLAKWQGYEELK